MLPNHRTCYSSPWLEKHTGRQGRQAARATDYSRSSLTLATITYSSLVTSAHNSPCTIIIMAPDVVLVHRLCCDDVPPASFPPPSILSLTYLSTAASDRNPPAPPSYILTTTTTTTTVAAITTLTQSDSTNLHAGVCMHVQRGECMSACIH